MERLNINAAGVQEFMTLSVVDEDLARRIVKHRERNGPFRKLEDLLQVEGFTGDILELNRNRMVVGDPPPAPPEVVAVLLKKKTATAVGDFAGHTVDLTGTRAAPDTGAGVPFAAAGAGARRRRAHPVRPTAPDPARHGELPRARSRRIRARHPFRGRPDPAPEGDHRGRSQGLRHHPAQHRPCRRQADPPSRSGDRRLGETFGGRTAGRDLGSHQGQPSGRRLPCPARRDHRRPRPLHRALPGRRVQRGPRHGRGRRRPGHRAGAPRGQGVPRVGDPRPRPPRGGRGRGGLRLRRGGRSPAVPRSRRPGPGRRHLLHRRRRRALRRLHQARPDTGGVLLHLLRADHRTRDPRTRCWRSPARSRGASSTSTCPGCCRKRAVVRAVRDTAGHGHGHGRHHHRRRGRPA